MITLYTKNTCPYTPIVVEILKKLELQYKEKNLDEFGVVEELTAKGGKSQVPYIFDDATSIGLYDSKLILSYLEETYGKGQIEL